MFSLSRQGAVVAGVVVVGITWVAAWSMRAEHQAISAAFWFERVTYDESEVFAERLGGAMTQEELRTIDSIARAELRLAFANTRLTFSDSRDAMYRVRVTQNLRGRFSVLPVAGESRPLPGRRGLGAVNFLLMANSAVVYAPSETSRQAVIEAIGRGIGRTAVHEFAHQLVGSFALHNTADRSSYEYADIRREHFYGDLHWTVALPMLEKRIGLSRPPNGSR
jgi:hypothetical protein